jgi:hypothetical protein
MGQFRAKITQYEEVARSTDAFDAAKALAVVQISSAAS